MTDAKRTGLAGALAIAAALVAHAALCAAETEDTQQAQAERGVVYREGFESAGRMTIWAHNGDGCEVNFAGSTDERAASGKRSFKIDVTWKDGCTYLYWWVRRGRIGYYGNPVARGKIYAERGGATFGHAYAVPEAKTTGNKGIGVHIRSLPDGWAEWRSSAVSTPVDTTPYLQGVAVYLHPDKERRTVIYVDDLEVEAALAEGYEAELDARIAETEANRIARLRKAAGMLLKRFAKLAAEIDATPLEFPASAPAELKDYWERPCRHRDQLRSQLETQLAELQTKLTSPGVGSARGLLSQLEKAHPYCMSLAAYAAAHPALPYTVWIVNPISNDHVLPERFPVPGSAGTELSLFACPGEYEPVSFALQAIKKLRDVTVECSDARLGKLTLPASQIDVRIVKCWWQGGVDLRYGGGRQPTFTPELLLKDPEFVSVDHQKKSNTLKDPQALRDAAELQPVSIPAGTTQQFWVTVHVPENAKAGIYRAALTLRSRNAPQVVMPLSIEVLPFQLEEPVLTYSIYYRGVLAADLTGTIDVNRKSPQQYLAEMRNLKAHGVTHPNCYGPPGTGLDRTIELRKQAGLAIDPFYSLGVLTGRAKSPGELEASRRQIRSAVAWASQHGIKEFYIYGIDEAHGEELKAERPAFKVAHEAGAKIFVACRRASFPVVGDLLDLAVMSRALIPGEAEKWHSVGHRIFSYGNPQVGEEQPETYRRNYGLGLWKAGYDGAMNYAYQHATGDIWDDFDAARGFRDHVFAYPTVDGVIDTIQWEGFREGVDDVRYLTTLLKAIEKAKAGKDKDDPAREAKAWIGEIDITGDLQALRANMVEWILRLGK